MTAGGDPSHEELREALGAYALGHLPRGQQRRVERHLSSCASCRAELDEVAPVADRLRELSSGPGIERTPSVGRRGLVAAAVLGLVVALGAGGLLGRTSAPDAGPAAPIEPVALAAGGVTQARSPQVTDAGLIAHTWGVELLMSGSGFREGAVYRVRFRSETGTWRAAGEFIGTGSDELDCNMQSGLLREDAVAVQVLDADGRPVLAAEL